MMNSKILLLSSLSALRESNLYSIVLIIFLIIFKGKGHKSIRTFTFQPLDEARETGHGMKLPQAVSYWTYNLGIVINNENSIGKLNEEVARKRPNCLRGRGRHQDLAMRLSAQSQRRQKHLPPALFCFTVLSYYFLLFVFLFSFIAFFRS